MGKALRLTRRSRSGSVHGLSTYPYAPKVVHPRGKPLQRTPYSASDLRRLFASVSAGQNGTSSSVVAHDDASFARRAAGSLERLIARLLHASPNPATLTVEGGHEVVLEPVLPLSRRLSDQTDDAESHSSWSSDRQLMRRELHLKRLGFVLTYSEYYLNWTIGLVSSVYATGRALVPAPLAGVAGSLEHRVTELSLPVINVVQDQSERVLTALDAKLDGVITTAAGVAGAPAAFLSGGRGGAASSKHAAGGNGSELDHVLAAKNAYLRAIEDAVQLVKEKGITGAAQCAADAVTATVSNAKNIPPLLEIEAKQLLYKVGDAWVRLIQMPPVSMLLAAAAPSVDFAWHKYLAAHDAVVSAPTYSRAVGLGAEQLERVQGSYMYRALYPHISPYADPALDAVAATGTFNALVDHLRPVQPCVTA